ncbi:hypothetical protein L7F22_058109 [Adiantum nelumboides]|nr:hypothetical protein [Adiantum nelumboides]
MPIITRNKAKEVDHADEIPISMTQESGSSHGTNSIIEPSNITTLDLVPSSVVPTSDTPSDATNEPLSDCFGSLVDSHISAGWIDSHILPFNHLLPRIPLCRLLANPAIRTQDDCVAVLTTSIAEQDVQEMPDFGFIGIRNAWVDSEREETGIYPEDWIDDLQGTDAWRDCPWFLDYADGEFPDVEEGAYHAHHKKVKGKGKSSSATINQPKDAHSPSTAKGRPPRIAKGRPSTSKKRPHPAVSESSESLEEQFELLSREDAEDSRHADSEQQSDSRWSSPSGRSRSHGSSRSSPSRQSRSQGSRWSSPARGSRSRDSRARTSDTARSHPSGAFKIFASCWGHFRIQDRWTLTPDLKAFDSCGQTCLPTAKLMQGLVEFHCGMYSRIVQSVFTIATEFLLDDGTLVVACRAEHLFKVATLIVAMFVRDLDGPLPVPFYDRRAGDIAADIDGYEADSDML